MASSAMAAVARWHVVPVRPAGPVKAITYARAAQTANLLPVASALASTAAPSATAAAALWHAVDAPRTRRARTTSACRRPAAPRFRAVLRGGNTAAAFSVTGAAVASPAAIVP